MEEFGWPPGPTWPHASVDHPVPPLCGRRQTHAPAVTQRGAPWRAHWGEERGDASLCGLGAGGNASGGPHDAGVPGRCLDSALLRLATMPDAVPGRSQTRSRCSRDHKSGRSSPDGDTGSSCRDDSLARPPHPRQPKDWTSGSGSIILPMGSIADSTTAMTHEGLGRMSP